MAGQGIYQYPAPWERLDGPAIPGRGGTDRKSWTGKKTRRAAGPPADKPPK